MGGQRLYKHIQMRSGRVLWIDNLRGILILLVVLGHSIQYSYSSFDNLHLYNYIYSFHMPLFMVISGFVSCKPIKNDGLLRIVRAGKQLLIPYITWTVLLCLICHEPLLEYLVVTPFYWFLILLFIIRSVIIVSQVVCSKLGARQDLLFIPLCLTFFIIHGVLNPTILSLNILHVHFFFFIIGYYLRKHDWIISKSWTCYFYGLAFIILGWFYLRNSSPNFLWFLPASFYFILSGFFGSVFFINLFKKILDVEFSPLEIVGKSTLGIYVIHLFVCALAEPFFHGLVSRLGLVAGVSLVFFTLVVVSALFTALAKRTKILKFII